MSRFNPQHCRSESDVESKLIVQHLLPALGYLPQDWHQQVAFGRIRLDFLAFAAQILPFQFRAELPLCLVIEAKKPWQDLDRHTRRLRQYLSELNARFGILTNGSELRVYELSKNDLNLLFRCAGEEISDKMEEIRALVGKESMTGQFPVSPAVADKTISPENKFMKTIAVYHNKGGVGKTTVSVNLAAALRRQGNRVLLVDLDSQANATFAAGLVKFQFDDDDTIKEKNVFHLLRSGDFNSVAEVARRTDFFNTPEFDVVPAHINLIEGQYELSALAAAKTRLISKLNAVKDDYDFVIIDTPPSRDIYAQIALIAADYLIIPSDLKPFANQGLASVRDLISEINEFKEVIVKPPLKVLGVLPSKVSTNPRYMQSTFPAQKNAVIKTHNLPVFDSIIFERIGLSHCLNQTIQVKEFEIPNPQSIFNFADENQAAAGQSAQEFENFTAEVLRRIEN